jgi:hypothetical protein
MPSSSDSQPGSGFLGFLCIGLILLIASGVYGVQAGRFALAGQQTHGKVTECFSYGTRSRGQTCHYNFQVDGKTYSGSIDGPEYSEGNTVMVKYLGNDPSNNALDNPSWYPAGLILLAIGLVAMGASARQFMSNDDLLAD